MFARARNSAVALFGLAILFTTIGVLTAAAQQAPPPTVGGGAAFQPIAQVFTNPRCYNCHGGVDPFTGLNHGGGAQPHDNEVCIACHVDAAQYGFVTASDDTRQRVWRMAPPSLNIVGKSTDEICGMLHRFEAADPTVGTHRVAQHVNASKMVLLAFEGKRAGASSSVDPPPGTLADLVQQAKDWDAYDQTPSCLNGALNPGRLDFGDVPVGDSRSLGMTITNNGAAFSIDSIDMRSVGTDACTVWNCAGPDVSVLQTSTCGTPIAAGGTCSIQMVVSPLKQDQFTLSMDAAVVGDSASFGGTDYSDSLRFQGSIRGISPASTTAKSVQFGTVPLRQQVHQTVDVVNLASSYSISISNAHIVSPLLQDAGDFSIVSANPAGCTGNHTIGPKGVCTFDVVFAPDDAGNRKRWLAVDVKDFPTVTVELDGTGISAGAPSFSPASLDFGQRRVGTVSAATPVTLTNVGDIDLNIGSITLGGTYIPFSHTHNCPSTLASGASCTVNVTYHPGSRGAHSSTLNVYSDAPGSPHTVALTGIGMQPVASVSPTSLWFGTVAVGATVPPQTLTLSNSGNDALAIGGISLPGGFTQANNCGNSLAAAATCSIAVTFSAATDGTYGGVISITTDAPGSPHQPTVEGKAQGPKLTLSATTLDFGPVAVNTTSAARTLTLTNDGLSPLTFSQATFLTFFSSPRNTCSSAIVPGASCTVDIEFKPTTATSYSESAWIVTNAPGSPHELTLKGAGSTPSFALSRASLGFATQALGTTSAAQTVSLSNTRAVPLTIGSITSSSLDFGKSSTCPIAPATLSAGASCAIDVTFSPHGGGLRSGQIVVASNAQPASQWVEVSGIAPALAAAPSSLSFGTQSLNTTGAAQPVTLTNRGGSPITIGSVSLAGMQPADFGVASQTCTSAPVQPEQTCTVLVTFRPTATGSRAASLDVAHNDPAGGSPSRIALSGSGVATAVALDPSSVDFGNQAVGGTSDPPRTVTFINNDLAALTLKPVSISGANPSDFVTASDTCSGATVGVGASCTVALRFRPTTGGSRGANLVFGEARRGGASFTTALSGTGLAAAISLMPSTVDFGTWPVGVLSQPAQVEVRNTGNASATGLSVSIGGANASDFLQGTTCPTTLLPNGFCTITVRVQPQATDTRSATLSVTSSAPTRSVSLSEGGGP